MWGVPPTRQGGKIMAPYLRQNIKLVRGEMLKHKRNQKQRGENKLGGWSCSSIATHFIPPVSLSTLIPSVPFSGIVGTLNSRYLNRYVHFYDLLGFFCESVNINRHKKSKETQLTDSKLSDGDAILCHCVKLTNPVNFRDQNRLQSEAKRKASCKKDT